MGTSANNLQSFRPFHPGELVKEELECRGIKQKDFAKKFGLSYSALNEILNAKRPISTEFALFLEALLIAMEIILDTGSPVMALKEKQNQVGILFMPRLQ